MSKSPVCQVCTSEDMLGPPCLYPLIAEAIGLNMGMEARRRFHEDCTFPARHSDNNTHKQRDFLLGGLVVVSQPALQR